MALVLPWVIALVSRRPIISRFAGFGEDGLVELEGIHPFFRLVVSGSPGSEKFQKVCIRLMPDGHRRSLHRNNPQENRCR
jgi:hypothetical protein